MSLHKRILIGFALLLFTGFIATADLYHTETDGQNDPTCPICRFQASSIGTYQTVCLIDFINIQSIVVVTEPDTPVCHHQPPTTIRLRAPPSR